MVQDYQNIQAQISLCTKSNTQRDLTTEIINKVKTKLFDFRICKEN